MVPRVSVLTKSIDDFVILGQVQALYDFTAGDERELSIKEGEILEEIESDDMEWMEVRNSEGKILLQRRRLD